MKDIDDTKAPLMEHLIELRRRLLWCMAALAVACFASSSWRYDRPRSVAKYQATARLTRPSKPRRTSSPNSSRSRVLFATW